MKIQKHVSSSLVVVSLSLVLGSLVVGCDEGGEAGGGGAGGEGGVVGSGGSAATGGTSGGSEAPASCEPLLTPLVGEYEVTDPSAGHTRGTIRIEGSGAIDFDEDVAFTGADIEVCYDRTNQDFDRRVQISYGADDDGPVINVYLDEELVPTEIQFRQNDEGIDVRVPVGPATPLE